ncbi:hypothetical protein E2562_023728 [Oryza meyeriana var. granulata]|uniref:Uncharacterized protein n=1 Tax=Oryza meyeriana var. granulata TaxID=110450 RepID=A0A6G1DLW7_9ORYZ|nr:hypothetical protein E2562_023728 [Oryza meyeriana var. granulata]
MQCMPRQPPPVACAPPAPRCGRARVYDCSNPHRSARLAGKPALPTKERCQWVLLKQLGLHDEASSDAVLADYVAMFNGPLPGRVWLTSLTRLKRRLPKRPYTRSPPHHYAAH